VSGGADGEHVEGVATVIGFGGMFLRSKTRLPPGSSLPLKISCSAVSFQAECNVRHFNEAGMGVEYTALTPENEEKLKAFLHQLQT
jgi:hypothetical protein